MPEDKRLAGVVLMIGYSLFMVFCDASAKLLSATESVVVIVWYRYFFHTLSLILIACYHYYKFREAEYVSSHPFQLVRGIVLVISTLFFFHSIASMPLAEALALLYVFPLVAVLLSVVILKEPFTRLQLVIVIAAFIGVILILQPNAILSNPIVSLKPGLYALLAGIFMGIYMYLTKASSLKASPNMASLYTGVVGITLIPFFPGFELVKFEGQTLYIAAFMGLCAAIGHYLMFLSMRFAPASVVSPYAFSEIIFATGVGYVMFGDTLNIISFVAIALLITSGVIFARTSQ